MNHEDLILAAQLAENEHILAARLRPHDVLVGGSWRDYRQMPALELGAVVALSVGLDPYFADLKFAAVALTDPFMSDEVKACCEQFMRRLTIAKANLEPGGTLPVIKLASGGGERKVRLIDFAQLADRLGWELPEEFPRGATNRYQNASRAPETGGRMPSGTHDTKLLQALNDASREFWSTYDPEQPSTAPRSEDVVNWLVQERKVSKRAAEIMAQTLRADGLPTGPRK